MVENNVTEYQKESIQNDGRHAQYMNICLELAARSKAEGNLGIGALVVRGSNIIARAGEKLPGSLDVAGHAELLAVRLACQHLKTLNLHGCALYTTAEPCWMCAYTIRETGIETVVIGAVTRDVGAVSSKYPILSDPTIQGWPAPPQIITGVLEQQCIAARI